MAEIPFDLLLFHVCLPVMMEKLSPGRHLKALLLSWLVFLARKLSLSHFLLGERVEMEENTGGAFARMPASDAIDVYNARSRSSQMTFRTALIYRPVFFRLRVCSFASLVIKRSPLLGFMFVDMDMARMEYSGYDLVTTSKFVFYC